MGTSLDSHLPPLNHHLEPKAISLSDYFDMEMVSLDSLEEGTSSPDSLEVVLSNLSKEVN